MYNEGEITMYGWRLRIGLIVPSGNIVMENEFYRVIHSIPGISIHATRIFLGSGSLESLLNMKKGLKRASKELKTAEVDVIAYGCTSGSFAKGLNFDKEIITEIETKTNIPATTTSTAVVEALQTLHVKKIAVGTPYCPEVDKKEKEFFESSGFKVITIKGLDIQPIFQQGMQPPHVAYDLGCTINSADAECIFISCTDFRTFEIIDALEKKLRKPVVSANQATLWHIFKMMNMGISISGCGSLLKI
ncbi:MAG: maleate cis-trans isomerase [Candidatus Methanofastidiosia archaeon]